MVTRFGQAVETWPEDAEFDMVVACDGARSVLRTQLTGGGDGEFAVQKRLGSLLQIKFQALGSIEAGHKSQLAEFANSLAFSSQFFRVLPSRYDPVAHCTPITIFSLLLEEVETIATADAVESVEALEEAFASHPKIVSDVKVLLESEFPDGITDLRIR